jgi:CHAT domain-containing protein
VTNKTRYTWQDVQKTLKVGEVAIEIIRFQVYDKKWTDTTKYMALIIKPNAQHPEMVVLHNGNDLEGKHFEEYQKNMKEKNTDKNAYLPYWGKIAQKLTGVKKVYLSADGIYQKLNLNTLLNPATGKYLLEELDIQLVTSTRDLVLPKKASKPHESAVLMGFPAYNIAPDTTQKQPTNIKNQENITNSKTRFFDGETIEELPATKIEVEKLQEILAKTPIKTTAYVGKEASEPTLKQVNSPSILHIATHGFFMESSKKEAEKELTLGMDSKKVFENPLLRSGVLLAHAKNAIKQGGDGVLTAYEAMNLNLDETDLVVLSACDTGLGEVRNGEGVYGLQRAFQTAGAKTVLMSLWKVSDNATQELSVEFYKNLILKKQSKQLAFKNAQNELRLRYPHPYYWGAFVMVGE